MFQKMVFAVLVTVVFGVQAQAQRVIYDPQAYIVGGTHAPVVNGAVGGEVYLSAGGDTAVIIAGGILDRARADNVTAMQIAAQATQPVVMCVPGSRCQPGYCMAIQQARQPVFVHRQTPQLPAPPAPNMYVFPAGNTVVMPPANVWNNNAPVQISPPVTQYQGGQTSANWNAPHQAGGAVNQGQGGQGQLQAAGHPCPGCPNCQPQPQPQPAPQAPVQQQQPPALPPSV